MNLKHKYQHPPRYGTLKECFFDATSKHADKLAYRQVVDSRREEDITFGDLRGNVIALGTALLKMGLAGKHIAVIGENSIEWMTAYLSVVCGTGVAVPIDKELDPETLALQIDYSDSETVFVSASAAPAVWQIVDKCPNVKHWILMRPQKANREYDGWLIQTDLINANRDTINDSDNPFVAAEVKPESLCDIIFTSGTTGANKGVMLSHKNVCSVIADSLTFIKVPEQTFAVLPINHSFEKNCHVLCCLSLGRTVCINDSLMHLQQNIKRFDAGLSVMVPMMLETIHHRIIAESKKTGLDKHLNYAIWFSNLLRKVGIDRREKFFKPVLRFFGNNMRQIITGGAPLNEETRKFLDGIGITVVNGYGITECGPLVSANLSGYQRAGTVGKVIPGCEVRIDGCNERGEGTVMVKGDNVMMGYYKDSESTKQVLTADGWLDTGDIGKIDRHKFITLSGRVKNLIILSNGKNISPEELEMMLCNRIPYIKETIVYADAEGLGIYATCYLDPDFIAENGIANPYEYLKNDLVKFNKSVPTFKRISDVKISETEFQKTTTRKVKRFTVEKMHQKKHEEKAYV